MVVHTTFRLLKTTLWVFVIIYLGILSTYLILKARKLSDSERAYKKIIIAWAMLMHCYIFTRIFFLLSDFEKDLNGLTLLHNRFVIMGYIFISIGGLTLIFQVENYILEMSHHIFSFGILIAILIDIIFFLVLFPDLIEIARIFHYTIIGVEVFIISIIYIYLAKKTSGRTRKKSILVLLGILVFIFGVILDSNFLPGESVRGLLSPIVFALGITIFFYAQMIRPTDL